MNETIFSSFDTNQNCWLGDLYQDTCDCRKIKSYDIQIEIEIEILEFSQYKTILFHE